MGVQRRKRREVAEARAAGSETTSRADIETEYLEKADDSLREQEFTSKAFNVMWIDFFKMFALLTVAISLYSTIKHGSAGENGLTVYHSIGMLVFLAARSWLGSVDVILQHPEGFVGPTTREMKIFLLAVLLQLMVLPGLYIAKQPLSVIKKCFPTGLVFLVVALLMIGYMRYNVRKTVQYRANLSKTLFPH